MLRGYLAATVVLVAISEGRAAAVGRALPRRLVRGVRAYVIAAAPLPPLLPLLVRDAQPSEVSEIAALLSSTFSQDDEVKAGAGAIAGVVGPPFDARGTPQRGRAAPWAWPFDKLRKAASDAGRFWIEASLAQRLSAEAFAQGYDGREPAAQMAGEGGVRADAATSASVKNAYALLVAEVELEQATAGGRACALAAAVEIGVEEILPPKAVGEQQVGASEAPKPRLTPYLASLAVAPAYRRRGAARQLLARAESLALAWGYDEIVLDAAAANNAALQLYASSGYRLEGPTPLLDLPVAMLLRGDRASGRWRKRLGGAAAADADDDGAAALTAFSAVVGEVRGADGTAEPAGDRFSVWAEALVRGGWRYRWVLANAAAPFALAAVIQNPLAHADVLNPPIK